MFFYELHESDGDIFTDLYLANEELYEPDEFFELVQEIRHRVQDRFEHDTLVESIGDVLEREHGFVALTDARLSAAVRVSVDDDDNEITPTGELHRQLEPEWGDDDEVVDEEELLPGHRTVLVDIDLDLDPGRRARPN